MGLDILIHVVDVLDGRVPQQPLRGLLECV